MYTKKEMLEISCSINKNIVFYLFVIIININKGSEILLI